MASIGWRAWHMARLAVSHLAGFEPATGCLEDIPKLYRTVSHLGFVALRVRALPTPLVSTAGVRPPQPAFHCLLIRS
jgi:hypothetical protein